MSLLSGWGYRGSLCWRCLGWALSLGSTVLGNVCDREGLKRDALNPVDGGVDEVLDG